MSISCVYPVHKPGCACNVLAAKCTALYSDSTQRAPDTFTMLPERLLFYFRLHTLIQRSLHLHNVDILRRCLLKQSDCTNTVEHVRKEGQHTCTVAVLPQACVRIYMYSCTHSFCVQSVYAMAGTDVANTKCAVLLLSCFCYTN